MSESGDSKQLVAKRHQQRKFFIHELEVSPFQNTLNKDGTAIKLQPKVMAVLAYLAENQDRVIGNEELIEQVWGGRIVTTGSIQKSINALRKGLAHFFGTTEVIAHFSKRGYQLTIAPVFVDTEHHIQPIANKSAIAIISKLAIAVLLAALVAATFQFWPQIKHASIWQSKQHLTQFKQTIAIAGNGVSANLVSPHPDNQHLAFIQSQPLAAAGKGPAHQLLVRNNQGQQWVVANSKNPWLQLEWSPDGRWLAGVQLAHSDYLAGLDGFGQKQPQLYSIVFFALDLTQQQVEESHALSQWQGRIASISWYDDATFEFVASQGQGQTLQRYHYSVIDSALGIANLPALEGELRATTTLNGLTAVLSQQQSQAQITLLDSEDRLIQVWQLPFVASHLAWLPDMSGWLVHSTNPHLVYRDGSLSPIPGQFPQNHRIARFRYAPDGQTLYFDLEQMQTNLHWFAGDNQPFSISTQGSLNHSPRIAPGGMLLAHVSVNQTHHNLYLLDTETKQQSQLLQSEDMLDSLAWIDGQHLLFRQGNRIRLYDAADQSIRDLLETGSATLPVHFYPDQGSLIVRQVSDNYQNLWHFDLWNGERSQITFGAVAATWPSAEGVVFQYQGQPGLWQLGRRQNEITAISQEIPHDADILYADARGVVWNSGQGCLATQTQELDFASKEITDVTLDRPEPSAIEAFHPVLGSILKTCQAYPSVIKAFSNLDN